MKILINNQWSTEHDAKISLFNDGFMFGYGIFETLRTYSGRKTLYLEQHIDRLLSGCNRLNLAIEFSATDIQTMVNRVIEASPHEVQRLKILVVPGHLIIISTRLMLPDTVLAGYRLKTVVRQRSVPEVKSIAYLDCFLAYQEARLVGYDDALLLNNENYVLEASRSNIVWRKDDHWQSCRKNVLPGVTLQVIDSIISPVRHGMIDSKDLLKCQEVFICNSILGVMPVIAVDNMAVNNGLPGEQTLQLKNMLHRYIREL